MIRLLRQICHLDRFSKKKQVEKKNFFEKKPISCTFGEILPCQSHSTANLLMKKFSNLEPPGPEIVAGQLASKRKNTHRFEWMIFIQYHKYGRKMIVSRITIILKSGKSHFLFNFLDFSRMVRRLLRTIQNIVSSRIVQFGEFMFGPPTRILKFYTESFRIVTAQQIFLDLVHSIFNISLLSHYFPPLYFIWKENYSIAVFFFRQIFPNFEFVHFWESMTCPLRFLNLKHNVSERIDDWRVVVFFENVYGEVPIDHVPNFRREPKSENKLKTLKIFTRQVIKFY